MSRNLSNSAIDAASLLGEPPPVDAVLSGGFEAGRTSLLAAMGGVGKSFLALVLALVLAWAVATGRYTKIFGGNVEKHGTVVFLSAEDNTDDFHRRLNAIDPKDERCNHPGKLFVVPMIDLGGVSPLIEETKNGAKPTNFYEHFKSYLINLGSTLVIIDTYSAFCSINDLDTRANAKAATLLDQLAHDTDAAIVVLHHMKKVRADQITNLESAREAIKGNSAGLDRLRFSYALWIEGENDARRICTSIKRDYCRGCIIKGGVVKANGPHNSGVSTYYRHPTGRIEEVTEQVALGDFFCVAHQALLIGAIKTAALAQQPFTQTGSAGNSLYGRREELPVELRVGRDKIQDLCQMLIDDGRVIKCQPKGSQAKTALDVPGGPFDGEGANRLPGNRKNLTDDGFTKSVNGRSVSNRRETGGS